MSEVTVEPTGDLWAGVGAGIANSPGWMVVGAILVIGVLFVWAKYVHPDNKEIRLKELALRAREAENDAERIKANAALAENMRGLRESNDQLAQQSAALFAGIEESKSRSREMGGKVDRIDQTTQHSDTLIEDIHRHILGGEGTD